MIDEEKIKEINDRLDRIEDAEAARKLHELGKVEDKSKYISKDKIRAKIEELIARQFYAPSVLEGEFINMKISALQELLEEGE